MTHRNRDPRPRLRAPHAWNVSTAEARAIQNRLAALVDGRFGLRRPPGSVAGVDVGFEGSGSVTRAAVAVLGFPELEPLAEAIARRPTTFPYVPGLLSFREIPAVLDALNCLDHLPGLLLCDGQGYAHPRRFGLACHLGVITGIPSVGVAKTRLIGEHAEVGPRKGDWQPLKDKGETIGAAVRTRDRVSPLFVSVGHRINLSDAIRYTLACTTRFRLPETTRRAHRLASG
jgi:deoxyribonuclease V